MTRLPFLQISSRGCGLHSKLHRNMRKHIPHSLSGAFSIVATQCFTFQSLGPRLIRVPRPFVPGQARCLSVFLHGGCPTSIVLSQRPDSERDFDLLRITSYLDEYPWKERLGQIIGTDLGVTSSVYATRTCRYGLRSSERAYAQPSISTTSWQGWNPGL